MILPRRLVLPGVLGAATLLAGCVERTITINSEPQGALVYLNDEEVGRTPVSVPFLYYGTYDVRLEHEPEWMSVHDAAMHYGVSDAQIETWVNEKKMRVRENDHAERQVEVAYAPLWTQKRAKGPWWEAPGPDLVAEAVPNGKSEVKWAFRMYVVPPEGDEPLVERAKQLRATLAERGPATRPAIQRESNQMQPVREK
jgi:hypothetical protein